MSAHARLRQHVCFTAKSKNWRENYSSTLQGKMSANEVTTPKKLVKPSLENCKVCGITTQINAGAVISNPAGKTLSPSLRDRRGGPELDYLLVDRVCVKL